MFGQVVCGEYRLKSFKTLVVEYNAYKLPVDVLGGGESFCYGEVA